MSQAEIKEWAEYLSIEPPLSERMELQMAVLTSVVFNMFAKEPLGYERFLISKKEQIKDNKNILEEKLKAFMKGKK